MKYAFFAFIKFTILNSLTDERHFRARWWLDCLKWPIKNCWPTNGRSSAYFRDEVACICLKCRLKLSNGYSTALWECPKQQIAHVRLIYLSLQEVMKNMKHTDIWYSLSLLIYEYIYNNKLLLFLKIIYFIMQYYENLDLSDIIFLKELII